MKYEDKTKEELIIIIKELEQNFNSLNKSFNKHIAEQNVTAKMFIDIIDKNPFAIQILNMEGYTIRVNPAHTKLFGAVPPPDYSIFNDAQLLEHGFGELFEKIKKGENIQLPSIYYNTHNINPKIPDNLLWLTSKVFTLNDSSGKPEKIVVIHEDNTDRKLAANKLNESKKMLELVMGSIPQFIFWKDCNSVYLGCNENFAHVAGVKSISEIAGKTDYDLAWNKEEADFFVECDRRVISSGIPEYHIIEPQLQADGKQAWLETNKVPIFDESGRVIGMLGTYEDITERKQAEIDLIHAKEHAEESDRLKTAFLQNMSHEIRTPMNAIMGFSSLLPDYFDDKEKLEDFSKIINQRSEDLLDIINDILDISKIESGQSILNIEECNINELFSEIHLFFRDYQTRTNKQHIELILQPLHDESYAIVKTEKVKLKQILVNLIGNAFKFTETGTIQCGCEIEKNMLKFYVSDTGVGIPKQKFDFIFERFAQLNNVSLRNIGGTGLGLPIVKGLVDLLGGQVWLESECDKGSTFFFTIDYIPCLVPKKLAFNGVKNNDGISINKTMLIVEDDLFNAKYLNEILQKHVANICTVNNGADAIEFVKNNTVDVVLMDVRLPDITGYEATKEILKHNPAIKVIAQTAYAAQDERKKALGNGCVDYISKPTEQEQLLTILGKHLI